MSTTQLLHKKNSNLQLFIRIFITLVLFISAFLILQRLLVPKYASAVLEGGMVREYYDTAKNHDVIIIGDCETYTNYSTVTLWEQYGITSYIRGSPQQLVWHSYYILEDTLRYETPQVVIFNVSAVQYGEPQSEPYNRLTLDGMRLSASKLNAVFSSRTEDEDMLSYLLPFFRYKDRWKELSSEDFKYFFNNPRVSINGFMLRSDTMEAGFLPDPIRRADYTFSDKVYSYLERLVSLTKENNIKLILVKAPTLYPYWFAQWDQQIVAFAEQHDLLYINFLEHVDEIGIDYSTDTFNAGISLNVFGAERLARFLGSILSENTQFSADRHGPETVAYWNEMTQLYHRVIIRQQDEISEAGKITNLLME